MAADDDDHARRLEGTRQSWNVATRAHNAHKRDQAAFLKGGGSTLFPEELELLGPLAGKRLLHLQCNAGQDSLSLAARGAVVTGVDLSDEAVAFARSLSTESGIAATFHQGDVVEWLEGTSERFDLVFASYGALPWIEDLPRYAKGMARVLVPGGKLVVLEFHPLVWSFTKDWRVGGDPYFTDAPFVEAVNDYVGKSGAALAPSGFVESEREYVNPHQAHGWQHTAADLVQAPIDAGLVVTTVREWPYANGCRFNDGLVDIGGHRYAPPPPLSVPLMLGIVATRP